MLSPGVHTSNVYLSFGPQLAIRKSHEIDKIDDTKKFDPLAREITPRILNSTIVLIGHAAGRTTRHVAPAGSPWTTRPCGAFGSPIRASSPESDARKAVGTETSRGLIPAVNRCQTRGSRLNCGMARPRMTLWRASRGTTTSVRRPTRVTLTTYPRTSASPRRGRRAAKRGEGPRGRPEMG